MVSAKVTILFKLPVCSELYINLSLVLSENTHQQVMCSLVELVACLDGRREGVVGRGAKGERIYPPPVPGPVCSGSAQCQPCLAPAWPRAGAELPAPSHGAATARPHLLSITAQNVPACCRQGQHPGAPPAQQKYPAISRAEWHPASQRACRSIPFADSIGLMMDPREQHCKTCWFLMGSHYPVEALWYYELNKHYQNGIIKQY